MKLCFSAVAALSLMLLVAAAARAADEKVMQTPYYPLKVGNTWHYRFGDNHLLSKVTKHEEFEKELCARVEVFSGDKLAAVEHIAVKEDGVYRWSYGGAKVDPPLKFILLPPAKDQSWDVKSSIGAGKMAGTFKTGMVDEVKVPAGTYKDVYTCGGDFEADGHKISFTFFFAKDVGMVKQIIKTGGQEIVIELEKFEEGT